MLKCPVKTHITATGAAAKEKGLFDRTLSLIALEQANKLQQQTDCKLKGKRSDVDREEHLTEPQSPIYLATALFTARHHSDFSARLMSLPRNTHLNELSNALLMFMAKDM